MDLFLHGIVPLRRLCSFVVKENVEQKIELAKNLMSDVRVLTIFHAENPGIRSDLTKTDLEIIDKLLKNPRAKIEEIAKSTSLSSKTITRSLEKLQNDEAILFTLIYDPVKLEKYIPYAILVWVKDNLPNVLQKLQKEFSSSFLQKPFLAKNQVVLFMYSDDLYKLDNLAQQIKKRDGIVSADLFIPKKISFPQKWVKDIIKTAKNSKTLHLMYQTN